MMYYNHGFEPFYFLFHVIGWILLVVIILWAIRAITGRSGRHHMRWSSDPALDLLKERYVKGEITKEEFEAKKKDLVS